jgi:Uma2 family endonuclease
LRHELLDAFVQSRVAWRVLVEAPVAGATLVDMSATSSRVDDEIVRARTEPEPPRGEWWSDEPEMENIRHLMQMLALIATLRWLWRERTDYFVGGNLSVFFSEEQAKTRDFRGPDFMVALGVDGSKDRRSWVVWEEGGKYPNVIVELLSDSTRKNDRGIKKEIYQNVFRLPEYFLFDPETAALEGYRLIGGRYQSIAPEANGLLACEQLDLCFGVRDGELRFFHPDGSLVQKPEEDAELALRRAEAERLRAESALEAQRRAEEERSRAEQARSRAEEELATLREKLRRHGIE